MSSTCHPRGQRVPEGDGWEQTEGEMCGRGLGQGHGGRQPDGGGQARSRPALEQHGWSRGTSTVSCLVARDWIVCVAEG